MEGFLDLEQSFTGAYRSHMKKDACVFSFYLDSLFRSHYSSFVPRGGIEYKYNMRAGFQGLLSHTLNNA